MGQNDPPRPLAVPCDVVDLQRLLFRDRPLQKRELFRKFTFVSPCSAVHKNIPRNGVVLPFLLCLGAELADRGGEGGVAKLALHRLHGADGAFVLLARHISLRQFICIGDVDPAACAARNVDGDARHRHFVDVPVDGAHRDIVPCGEFACRNAALCKQNEEHVDHVLVFHV